MGEEVGSVRVYLSGLTRKDFEEAKERFKEIYGNDPEAGKEALFEGGLEVIEYLGDGDVSLESKIIDEDKKWLHVSVDLNVRDFMESDAFWVAIEDYVKQLEKKRRREEFVKKLYEVWKKSEGEG